MMDYSLIWGGIAGIMLVLLVVFLILKKKGRISGGTDYRALFVLGICLFPVGIATDNFALLAIGIIYMLIGLVNRKKWGKKEKWSDLTPAQRKTKMILIGVMVFFVIAGAVVLLLVENFGSQPKEETEVTSFQECAEAGNAVMESYPRQCRAGDKVFVEDIGNELEKIDLIRIDSPRPNSTVTSPLEIRGQARGYWFFEADFPVKLFDEEGNLLGLAIARAQSDWMTEEFVLFEAELSFEIGRDQKGTLVLEKDNPSGLAENADELHLPVYLEKTETRTMTLYYYNSELDKDESDNILCSRQGLVGVERSIPLTQTPIQDTINLLLKGELTQAERESGLSTEYPLLGLSLAGASLKDGVLTLEFSDPNNRTGGGSCRVGILWFQIEATAKQFSGVESVRFMPEELFQP